MRLREPGIRGRRSRGRWAGRGMAVVAVAAAAAFVHSPARADVIAFPEPMADAITELAAPGYGATPAEPGSQVWDIPPGADFAAAPVAGPLTTLAGAPLGTVTMYQPANGWVITGVMGTGSRSR